MLRLPPLFRSSHSFLSETNIPAPSPLFPSASPSPSISHFVSYSLQSVPLGQINFLCTENLVLGVPSRYHCLTDGALGATKHANLICCRPPTNCSNASHSTFQSLTYDVTALKPSYILYQVVDFCIPVFFAVYQPSSSMDVPQTRLGGERGTRKNHVHVVLSLFPQSCGSVHPSCPSSAFLSPLDLRLPKKGASELHH